MSGRLYAHANLDAKYGQDDGCKITDPDKANLVTSVSSQQPSPHTILHKPQMDLDVSHSYKHSTTPGHAHLQIDVEVPWEKYVQWLVLSAELGIIQEGWVNAATSRGYTTLRRPHVKKTEAQKKLTYPYGQPPPKKENLNDLFGIKVPF